MKCVRMSRRPDAARARMSISGSTGTGAGGDRGGGSGGTVSKDESDGRNVLSCNGVHQLNGERREGSKGRRFPVCFGFRVHSE